ncbi:CMRF35-like molecule 8 isoform X2 [Pygocentrus nattereri]|uniref:CMRF35-like molecule 8 isoform X2 n=1 Tax=Pygocentrus nattereri TaxID=42514 RepID=UPI001890CCE6|nr:CMRF35-like molecule 8 isoform X2 [Pygocentrus nattereri]
MSVLGSVMGDVFTLDGYVGGQIQVRCPHQFAHDNIKYFCNAECKHKKDVIIKSATNHNTVTRGRYSLFDEGSGVFFVTISNLKKSDSGTYWCGVERVIKDTFHKVILKVLDAPTSRTTPRLTDWSTSQAIEPRVMADSETSTTTTAIPVITTTTANTSDKKELIHIGAGLAALVLLLVIFLFILIQQSKQRKATVQPTEKAQHTENVVKYSSANTSSSVNQRTSQSIQDTPVASRGSHSDPSSTVYANFTPSHDSLSYATVRFANQSDDLNYSNVIFVKESDANTSHSKKSEVDTARSSSPLYATVKPTNTSHSDQDTNAVVYSTVHKVE